MNMIRVKVCGMVKPENAREVTGTGADYLGFIFYSGSKRYVGEYPDDSLFQQPLPGILKVGVFVNEKTERILELASLYSLNLVQLHGFETPEQCMAIRSLGLKVIKVFGVDARFDFHALMPYLEVCDYFLFDTKSDHYGGTGLKFNWEKMKQYNFNVPYFLSGGIGPEDASAIGEIRNPAFFAVDINSRFETEPGTKDIQKVKAFINEIKTAAL